MYNYDNFIVQLISGTKSNKIKWQHCSMNNFSSNYPVYETFNGSNVLILYKRDELEYYDGDSYTVTGIELILCDSKYNELSRFNPSEFSHPEYISRLYRIVERMVNNVDSILDQFVSGIDDLSGLY